jgi:hypothetical protein
MSPTHSTAGGRAERTDAKRRSLYFAYQNKEISIQQFRAQMRDLGYEDHEIDIYTDGDTGGVE